MVSAPTPAPPSPPAPLLASSVAQVVPPEAARSVGRSVQCQATGGAPGRCRKASRHLSSGLRQLLRGLIRETECEMPHQAGGRRVNGVSGEREVMDLWSDLGQTRSCLWFCFVTIKRDGAARPGLQGCAAHAAGLRPRQLHGAHGAVVFKPSAGVPRRAPGAISGVQMEASGLAPGSSDLNQSS